MSSSVGAPAETLKRSPLYPLHAELGARFSPFAGWELPIYYSSILQEHQAVRTAAGLFDVSHLGHVEASGASAGSQLQLLVTQDLLSLEPGEACYTPMLNPRGWILDEMIIYHLPLTHPSPPHPSLSPSGGEDKGEGAKGEGQCFRLVVNAANGDKVLAWMRNRLHEPARVDDLREKFGTLALQGPKAADVLAKVSSVGLRQVRRYAVAAGEVAGRQAWVARTGYTGEDGCELFLAAGDLAAVWSALLEAGKPEGIRPAGLGARDTLRLEAGLPLGGADLDERTTPLEAGLDWTVEWRKGPFIGREALERQRREGAARRLCGFKLKGEGVPRAGCPIFKGEERVGQVTSGSVVPPHPTLSPSGGEEKGEGGGMQAIGMGYVPPAAARPGTQILVEIHGRKVEAEIVKLPFYRRAR